MLPSQDEQKEQQQQGDNSDNSSILSKEIDSWNNFEYALREENRLLFNKMLSEGKENEGYIKAAGSKDEFFSAESLFMALVTAAAKDDKRIDCRDIRTEKRSLGSRYRTIDT